MITAVAGKGLARHRHRLIWKLLLSLSPPPPSSPLPPPLLLSLFLAPRAGPLLRSARPLLERSLAPSRTPVTALIGNQSR